jgi:hypothetical protein
MADKAAKVIEKFITETENDKIVWKKISRQETPQLTPLINYYEEVGWDLVDQYCFETKHKNAKIFLISLASETHRKVLTRFDVEYLILGIQKDGQELVPLNTLQQEQSNLFRLFNMIDRQVSQVNEVLDDILDDFLT